MTTLYKANILEANTHLSNAIESLTKPEYKEVVKAATLEKMVPLMIHV